MTEDEILFADMPQIRLKGPDKGCVVLNYLDKQARLITLRKIIRSRESEPEDDSHNRQRLQELYREEQLLEKELAGIPPDPILPPPAPLVKIQGVVEKYDQKCIKHYFDTEAYPPTRAYFRKQQERMESAAVVMAATGSAATAQGMVPDESRRPNVAWYVTGLINGKKFSGWLGAPFCREGELVELIAAPVDDEYLVYAIVRPLARSITMTSGCYRGRRQAQIAAMGYPVGVIVFAEICMFIVGLFDGGGAFETKYFEPMWGLLVVLFFIYFLPASWSIWRRYPFPKEALAEEIFTVIGWSNVENINLMRIEKKVRKEWKRAGITNWLSKSGWWFFYY